MLLRCVTTNDISSWQQLAGTVAELFGSPNMPFEQSFLSYMNSKIAKLEALIAVDRMSNECLGIIGFSRTNNRISWFAVSEKYRNKGIGARLLNTALRHLDTSKNITVDTFCEDCLLGQPARAVYQKAGFTETETFTDEYGNRRCRMTLAPNGEKRGGSFHYKYIKFHLRMEEENCPCCKQLPMPDGDVDIAELEYSYVTAERRAQGRLFGKCHVLIKKHYVNFEDIPADEMAGYMHEIQLVARALRKVTGAEKINYEIHANSLPHIHCHLFPRYLDDDFPSMPIDYRVCEPSIYESDKEFHWFVEQMREELKKII